MNKPGQRAAPSPLWGLGSGLVSRPTVKAPPFGRGSFTNLANTNISYFVGVNAADTSPQSILGGDRNLGPGTTPDTQYGFSPSDGRGNDVVINGAVCWSLKMHSHGNAAGAGNILLGDGSAQQATTAGFRQTWQPNASGNTNWAAGRVPSSSSFRLIFP
jgi:hypothetical protein